MSSAYLCMKQTERISRNKAIFMELILQMFPIKSNIFNWFKSYSYTQIPWKKQTRTDKCEN
jgi:hypothetical protein